MAPNYLIVAPIRIYRGAGGRVSARTEKIMAKLLIGKLRQPMRPPHHNTRGFMPPYGLHPAEFVLTLTTFE